MLSTPATGRKFRVFTGWLVDPDVYAYVFAQNHASGGAWVDMPRPGKVFSDL
jgi:hypothetical protein